MKIIDFFKKLFKKEKEDYIDITKCKKQRLRITHYENGGFTVGAEVINLKTRQVGVIIKNYKSIIKVMYSDGSFEDTLCYYFKRTGRHYPNLALILKKLEEKEKEV